MQPGFGSRVNRDESEVQPLGRGPYPGEQGPPLRLPFGLDEKILNAHVLSMVGEVIWTVFTRSFQGIRWPGLPGLICFMGMMLYACALPDPEKVFVFIIFWVGMLLVRKGNARDNYRKGLLIESASSGVPYWIMRICRCG